MGRDIYVGLSVRLGAAALKWSDLLTSITGHYVPILVASRYMFAVPHVADFLVFGPV